VGTQDQPIDVIDRNADRTAVLFQQVYGRTAGGSIILVIAKIQGGNLAAGIEQMKLVETHLEPPDEPVIGDA
jgi:hypothetical protein